MAIDPRQWERLRTQTNYDPIGDSQGAFANALADIGVPLYSPIGRAISSSYGPGLANAFLMEGATSGRQLGGQTMQEQYKNYVTDALKSGTATQKISNAYAKLQSGGLGNILRGPYDALRAQGNAYANPSQPAQAQTAQPQVGQQAAGQPSAAAQAVQPAAGGTETLYPITGGSMPAGYPQGVQSWQQDMADYIRGNYGGNTQQAIADLISRRILKPGATQRDLEDLFMQDTPGVGLGSDKYDQPDELTNEQEARMRSEGYSLEGGRYVYRGQPRLRPTYPNQAAQPQATAATGAVGAGGQPSPVPGPAGAPAGASGLRPQPPLNPYVGALLSLLYDPSALAGFQQGLASPLMGSALSGGLRDLTGLRVMAAQRQMSPTDDFFRALYGR